MIRIGRTTLRSTTTTIAGLAVAIGLAVAGPAAAATAAPVVPSSSDGWLRLAHLSPDTAAMDVRVSALGGGSVVADVPDVGYGAVSGYLRVPAGDYEVSLTPAAAPAGTDPALEAPVTVVAGEPRTFAAIGRNASIATTVIADDLTAPAAGTARVRVVQASTTTPVVDITTDDGISIVAGAASGAATGYAELAAGPWSLVLSGVPNGGTGSAASYPVDVSVADGTVVSVFVLDTAAGGLTATAVEDSASVGVVPIGGIQTGGGALAEQRVHGEAATATDARLPVGLVATVLGAAVFGAGALVLVARGRPAVERLEARPAPKRGEGVARETRP